MHTLDVKYRCIIQYERMKSMKRVDAVAPVRPPPQQVDAPTMIEFSRKSHKFEEGVCETRWEKMCVTDGLGVGSLRKRASEDSPAEFREAQESDIEAQIKVAARNCTHFDVANVVHKLDRFVCTSATKAWFKLPGMEVCQGRVELSMLMSTEVCDMFMELSSKVTKNVAQKEDNEGELRLAKSLHNVALKLKNTGFKQSVLQECSCLFFKDNAIA
jgi:hypothetical protein